MKSVLISIQPKWCELIASGKKTVEVRKTAPKCDTQFKVFIYKTFGKKKDSFSRNVQKYFNCGKVIGEFVCDNIEHIVPDFNPVLQKFYYGYVVDLSPTCLTEEELQEYAGIKPLYFWHISDLKIYDKPKKLGEFRKPCSSAPTARCYPDNCERCPWNAFTRPPQSWGYVEE